MSKAAQQSTKPGSKAAPKGGSNASRASTGAATGAERRQHPRRPIIESFSLFLVVPKKGVHRLRIHDLSESGLGFELDIAGELASEFPVKSGEPLDVQIYLNQSLYLPLTVEIVRITEPAAGAVDDDGNEATRKVGTLITDRKSQAYKAYASFVSLLDDLSGAARLNSDG